MRPSVFSVCLGVPCRISPGHGCAAAEITSTFARVLAHPGSGCSRVALLASLTSPVFAQFADDGQRCVVGQIKREWIGLVLLGCGFRVHSIRAGAATEVQRPICVDGRPAKLEHPVGVEPNSALLGRQATQPVRWNAKAPEALLLRGSRDTNACRWASDERHSVADLGAIMHYFVKRRK